MAEKAGHYWFDMLDMDKFGLTTSKLQLVDNGVYISKYRITVPKELNDYEWHISQTGCTLIAFSLTVLIKTRSWLNFKVNLFVVLERVVSFAKLIFKLSMTQKYSIELIEEHDAVNFTAFILARKNSLNLKGSLKVSWRLRLWWRHWHHSRMAGQNWRERSFRKIFPLWRQVWWWCQCDTHWDKQSTPLLHPAFR